MGQLRPRGPDRPEANAGGGTAKAERLTATMNAGPPQATLDLNVRNDGGAVTHSDTHPSDAGPPRPLDGEITMPEMIMM